MDTDKKAKQGSTEPESLPRTQERKANDARKDDRETMGVDDKLIGDDLDIEQAERADHDEIIRPANEDNIY